MINIKNLNLTHALLCCHFEEHQRNFSSKLNDFGNPSRLNPNCLNNLIQGVSAQLSPTFIDSIKKVSY